MKQTTIILSISVLLAFVITVYPPSDSNGQSPVNINLDSVMGEVMEVKAKADAANDKILKAEQLVKSNYREVEQMFYLAQNIKNIVNRKPKVIVKKEIVHVPVEVHVPTEVQAKEIQSAELPTYGNLDSVRARWQAAESERKKMREGTIFQRRKKASK